MSKHTKGPWKTDCELGSSKGQWIVTMDCGNRGRGTVICQTRGLFAGYEDLENARLIAAAPDILAALKEAKAWIDEYATPNHRLSIIAQKAIEKAEPKE